MRRKGVLLVVGSALVAALGLVAFAVQRPPTDRPAPSYAVAKVAEVSTTPRPVEVVMRRGADRLLQRQRSNFGPCPGSMGCPSSTEVRPVTVFLVRDEGGGLHAFIGEDPRNGCALEWMTLPPSSGYAYDAVFHDVCHGSLYDRRGQRVGGPSPWDLNALATEVRGDDLYIDPGNILVGVCRGCPQSGRGPSEGGVDPMAEGLSVTREGDTLVVRIPIQKATPSASGKTLVVVSTRGNQKTAVKIDDKDLL